MANVRCPMCSKVNAPDAQVCAFCGARLKPLGAGSSAPQPPASRPEDDEPDWLSGLRGSDPTTSTGGSETTGAEANQDADLPDWLARIRGRAQTESGGADMDTSSAEEIFGGQEAPREPGASGGLPDWLNQQDTGSAQQPAAESQSDDDWLNRLQNVDSTGFGSEQTPAFSSTSDFTLGDEQETNLDWLNQPPAEDQSSQTPPFDLGGGAKEPAADDWMSAFSSWNPDSAQESEKPPVEPAAPSSELSGFGLTGFLSNLETGEEKPPEPPPAVETGSGGFGLTGFLSSLEGGTEQPSAPAQPEETSSSGYGLTGFLSSLETGEEQPGAPIGQDWNAPAAGAPATSSAEEALPDWLSGAEQIPPSSEPAIPTGTTGDLSSWLASLEGEQPLDPGAVSREAPTTPDADAEQLPSWLASAGQESAPAVPQQAQPDESLPGWLSETSAELPEAQTPTETAHLGEDTTSWFAGPSQPTADAGTGTEGLLPDWLSTAGAADFSAPSAEEASAADVPVEASTSSTGPAPFIDEDAPAWLRDFGTEGTPEPSTEGESVSPLLESDPHPQMAAESEQPFAVDLPDWLDEDGARTGTVEGAAETGVPSEELARAELPSWVAAMRPVESVMPGSETVQDTDQFVEKAGPLSGMRGVLPIPENLIRYRKPPIYSVKLHTTEKQRNQSALLDSIIAQESQPLLIPPARSHAPHLIMRIVIALILVAVVALPNLMQMFGMPFEALSTPALQPVELEEMYNQINQGAQPGEEFTVLLAFDYDPGLSGEMRAAASPVIRQLMQQNARIAVVSTSPTGPVMANWLLSEVREDPSVVSYNLENRTVNLGFLPGGTISLLEFVRQPRFAAPATLTGEDAWENTFLSSIDSIQDFSQVIVLTDSAETGRAWVEQVSPQMGEVPLFMVASAQAAPMLIPYLNAADQSESGDQQGTGQIDGMVSGLMGGAQYGWLAGQQNTLASNYWASYQLGVVLAIVLVLAGGLISGIRRLLARGDKEEA